MGNGNYLFREGLKNFWSNRMMSLASISVLTCCLLLMGAAAIISVNVNSIMDYLEGQNVIMVYVKDGVDAERVQQIGVEIENIGNIRTVEFIPKDDAFDKWMNQLIGDSEILADIQDDGDNPLPDAYKVTLKNLSDYDITLHRIKKIEDIEQINDKREYAEKLQKINNAVTIVGLALVLVLFAVSLFIITNTIKLTMYVRRLEISIMKSVGATNSFIRIPFVIEGLVIGVISSVLSYILLFVIYSASIDSLESVMSFGTVAFSDVALWFAGAFLIAGILISVIGSVISISKYLRKEGRIDLD